MRIAFAFVFLLMLWSPAGSFAQGQQQTEPSRSQKQPAGVTGCQLRQSFDLLSIESAFADLNGMGHFRHFRGDSNKLKTAAQAGEDFKSWLEKNKSGVEISNGQCYPAIAKYAPALMNLVGNLRLEEVGLLYSENDMPFRLFAKEKSEGVLLSAVTSDQIYNTLKLDARQRAAKEFDSTAVPILREMRKALSQTSAQYYGVIMLYGARDFSQDEIGGLDIHTDMLAVVADHENCEDLEQGRITEDEFADKSDIYLSSGSDPALVKIRLKFE